MYEVFLQVPPPAPNFNVGSVTLQRQTKETAKKRQPNIMNHNIEIRGSGGGGVKRNPLQKCCNISFAYRLGSCLSTEILDPQGGVPIQANLFIRLISFTRRHKEIQKISSKSSNAPALRCVSQAACTNTRARNCQQTQTHSC